MLRLPKYSPKYWHKYSGQYAPSRLMRLVTGLAREESGAAAAEYGLLVAAIAAVMALAVVALGDGLTEVLQGAANCVETGCL